MSDAKIHTKALDYRSAAPSYVGSYVWPILQRILEKEQQIDKRAFEIGCGNGTTANMLTQLGYAVTGVDPSESGVEVANTTFPHITIRCGNIYDDLPGIYGKFPLVVSFEVVEHLYAPRILGQTMYDMLEPSGLGILSTPYHGYIKNLALSVTGKWDRHLQPIQEGGHIKFFSNDTLTQLLKDSGFRDISILRAVRVPPLAKSMIAVLRK
jgi:2-polyprenyl-6-hydroxyphenyl methylase/3-demethylubiquinone-9 3-methyltransferase